MARIHILGASGVGTTTLGGSLSAALDVPLVDSDTLFWLPTEPPFTTRRPEQERQAMLHASLPVEGHWVFSGSAIRWATALEACYDLIVFLQVAPAVRMRRLRERELARYGDRVRAGGDLATASAEFLDWAASYDRGDTSRRSLAAHEAWLARQTAQILRLDGNEPVPALTAKVLHALGAHAPSRNDQA